MKKLSAAEVCSHPEAESIYRFIRNADYGPKWTPIARAMTRKQWTRGVREFLEDFDRQEPYICDRCKRVGNRQ